MMNTRRRLAAVLALLATSSSLAACATMQGLLPSADLGAQCTAFRDELATHAKANPALNGTLDQAANAAWAKKNDEILKRFFLATGVTVDSGANSDISNPDSQLDQARTTMTALVQASAKCKIAGVDMINP